MAKYAPTYMSVYDGPDVHLGALTLGALTFSAAASAGTVIGAIGGKSSGTTLSVALGTGKVNIVGNNLVVGTGNSAGSLPIKLRETAGEGIADNSPRDTNFTLTVTA